MQVISGINELKRCVSGEDAVIAAGSVRGTPLSVIKAMDDFDKVRPIIIVKGFEHGKQIDEEYYYQYLAIKNRIRELYGDTKTLLEPIVFHDAELWRLISVRYASEIIKRLGVYYPCIGCKAYFIVVQTLLAHWTSGKIIMGEKPDKKKIYFREYIFSEYIENVRDVIAETYNIEFLKPMQGYKTIEEAKEIIGKMWPFIIDEPSCIFKNNEFTFEGKREPDEIGIVRYFDEIIMPVCVELVDLFLHHDTVAYKDAEVKIGEILSR